MSRDIFFFLFMKNSFFEARRQRERNKNPRLCMLCLEPKTKEVLDSSSSHWVANCVLQMCYIHVDLTSDDFCGELKKFESAKDFKCACDKKQWMRMPS